MNWTVLVELLAGANSYSTAFSRLWLSTVFVFRVLVLVVAAQPVWSDDNKDFLCNTAQPGCTNACYDSLNPILPIRLWALQLICVTCPSLVVVGHVKWRTQKNEKSQASQQGPCLYAKPGKKLGGLWWTYLTCLIIKAGLDCAFLYILYYIGAFQLPAISKCSLEPCPNTVDCFLSRPTEKIIFTIFMASSTGVCVLLCVCEILYLLVMRYNKIMIVRWQRDLNTKPNPELSRKDPVAMTFIQSSSNHTAKELANNKVI